MHSHDGNKQISAQGHSIMSKKELTEESEKQTSPYLYFPSFPFLNFLRSIDFGGKCCLQFVVFFQCYKLVEFIDFIAFRKTNEHLIFEEARWFLVLINYWNLSCLSRFSRLNSLQSRCRSLLCLFF